MNPNIVDQYAVLLGTRALLDRAKMIAELARSKDPAFPAWENLPPHTQFDFVEIAARGMADGGGQ